jgi:hypothetical protein
MPLAEHCAERYAKLWLLQVVPFACMPCSCLWAVVVSATNVAACCTCVYSSACMLTLTTGGTPGKALILVGSSELVACVCVRACAHGAWCALLVHLHCVTGGFGIGIWSPTTHQACWALSAVNRKWHVCQQPTWLRPICKCTCTGQHPHSRSIKQ